LSLSNEPQADRPDRKASAASYRHGLSKNKKNCFVVRDHNGQRLGYVYFEDEPGLGGRAR
jgi:hypothetical protein